MKEKADDFPKDQLILREKNREVVVYARLIGVERELIRRPIWKGGTQIRPGEANLALAILHARSDLGLPYARIYQRTR